MTRRPRLSANLRSVVTGPLAEPALAVVRPADTRPAPPIAVKPPLAGVQADSAAALVVDAFATATVLSCLAWSQGAMLPLRLAALAWRQSAPRAAGSAETLAR